MFPFSILHRNFIRSHSSSPSLRITCPSHAYLLTYLLTYGVEPFRLSLEEANGLARTVEVQVSDQLYEVHT
jgi:hypothetical protein